MIAAVLLIVLVAVAAITDIWIHKVFNWTTYSGICCAFLLSAIESVVRVGNGNGTGAGVEVDTSGSQAGLFGSGVFSEITIGQSIGGFLLCGFVLLICFVLFNVGGGDVKLIAMIGAFMGIQSGIEALLWTFVLGGATALTILIWRVGAFKFVRRIFQIVMWKIRLGGWGPLTDEEKKELEMPLYLAPNALVAVLVVQFSLFGEVW